MENLRLDILANIIAAYAELEAMKLDNKIRELNELTTFNYTPDDFFKKASEIRSLGSEIYR
jgi:hypothetical protein